MASNVSLFKDLIDTNTSGEITWSSEISSVTVGTDVKAAHVTEIQQAINTLENNKVTLSWVDATVFQDTLNVSFTTDMASNVKIYWDIYPATDYPNVIDLGNLPAGANESGFFQVPYDCDINYKVQATLGVTSEVESSAYIAAPTVDHSASYSTAGSYQITIPNRITTFWYSLAGAGGGGTGGGGGRSYTINGGNDIKFVGGGGGGAGGASAEVSGSFSANGGTMDVIIGAGGSGGVRADLHPYLGDGSYCLSGVAGVDGDTSTITISDQGVDIIAMGGEGGNPSSDRTGGTGGNDNGGTGGNGVDSLTEWAAAQGGAGGEPTTSGSNGGWGGYGGMAATSNGIGQPVGELGADGENGSDGYIWIGWQDYE